MSETALVVEARRIRREVADLCADEVGPRGRFPMSRDRTEKVRVGRALLSGRVGGVGAGWARSPKRCR